MNKITLPNLVMLHGSQMLHGSHFRNRPPWLMQVQFHMPQYLKMFMVYQSICVPILVLLSQSERLVQYA